MFLAAVKLRQSFFYLALISGVLVLLFPKQVPWILPVALAVAWAGLLLYTIFHITSTRRRELQCPQCGWVPFALPAWKCKECRFQWDYFATDGKCPRCGHAHDEAACVRCRRISPNERWRV